MGAWGVMAHESDNGLDAMMAVMDYGKENGGNIQLAGVMDMLRKEGYMLPTDAVRGEVLQESRWKLSQHEFTVLALAEAVENQHRSGSYSAYNFNMLPILPILGVEVDQSAIEPEAEERVVISFTAEDLEMLKGEIRHFLEGPESETHIRFGWREPDEWLQQTKATLGKLEAIKPSILAQLKESKQAAEQPDSPKTPPKQSKDMEV